MICHSLSFPDSERRADAVYAACAEDPRLVSWSKVQTPFLALPPPSLPLTGWRDPYVIQKGGNGRDWVILMGAGLKGEGGTTLIYRAQELTSAWVYDGLLCLGDPDLGAMWECPLLLEVPPAPGMGTGVDIGIAGGQLKQVSATEDNALIFSHSAASLQVRTISCGAQLLWCLSL